ncbi:MAG: hypothetical protein ACRDTF_21790 [Pseudonocardiaceae bacterium]
MRQRVLSLLAWVAVTALATGIGFLAISTVGNVLRGSGPLGEDFSIATHSHDVPQEPVLSRQSTHHHPLATLTVQCVGRTATLLDSRPAPGAIVVGSDVGPDEDVHLDLDTKDLDTKDLDTKDTAVRLEVYCNRGESRLAVERRW